MIANAKRPVIFVGNGVTLSEGAEALRRGHGARALLHEPQVLYLDEPTANLDIHSAEVVHRILRERVRAGATIVLTTHDMDEVEKICDRVGIMARGKLVALDSPLALKQRHTERKVDVIRGTAAIGPGPSVVVDGRTIAATDVVIATGSRPKLLPGVEVSEHVITSDQALWYPSIPTSAIVIGACAGALCYFAVVWKGRFGYDDSLDVFGVHGVGGLLGTMLAGVFATASLSVSPETPAGVAGLLEGNPAQLGIQAIGVVVSVVWCLVGTWVSLKIIELVCGLRVTPDQEREGLDLALHGEALHQ